MAGLRASVLHEGRRRLERSVGAGLPGMGCMRLCGTSSPREALRDGYRLWGVCQSGVHGTPDPTRAPPCLRGVIRGIELALRPHDYAWREEPAG